MTETGLGGEALHAHAQPTGVGQTVEVAPGQVVCAGVPRPGKGVFSTQMGHSRGDGVISPLGVLVAVEGWVVSAWRLKWWPSGVGEIGREPYPILSKHTIIDNLISVTSSIL